MPRVPLSQGKFTLVDEEDLALVNQYEWYAHHAGRDHVYYAVRTDRSDGVAKTIRLHQFLVGGVGLVDHRNRDTLDNRRENLRISTRAQNNQNRRRHRDNQSGYKGVSFARRDQRWHARIQAAGRSLSLGYYATAKEAACAYDAAARKHHGEFAVLNFP